MKSKNNLHFRTTPTFPKSIAQKISGYKICSGRRHTEPQVAPIARSELCS